MSTKKSKWFCLATVIAVIGISVLISPAFAGEQGGTAKEGIKVHGHWKIEIFNPDGTRASVTEFENALTGEGAGAIIRRLTGTVSHGGWGIELDASTGTKPCDTSGSPAACNIGEAGLAYLTMNIHSSNLTVTPDFSFNPTPKIILSGSVTAAKNSTIDKVSTTYSFCGLDSSTADCRLGGPNNVWQPFTTKILPAPPSVILGQLIQVTVTISFS